MTNILTDNNEEKTKEEIMRDHLADFISRRQSMKNRKLIRESEPSPTVHDAPFIDRITKS
mgnify:CR=1 FL=1